EIFYTLIYKLMFWENLQKKCLNVYFYVFIYMLFSTAGSFADKIEPTDEDANFVRKETNTVTLKCSYETNSGLIGLYWYRQYPHSTPTSLLLKGAKSFSVHDYNPSVSRVRAETTSDASELIIKDLQISDSALYHCALL
ncbi:hypothetical protein C0J45_23318, partial [Silurus meridionalis]